MSGGRPPPARKKRRLEAAPREQTLIPEDPFPALEKAGDWDGLIDLAALDAPRRRVLEEAAYTRVALRLGYVTGEQIEPSFADSSVRIEDYLTQNGILD